ncbi:MAG TPA: GumC family protein [Steroidobacteraceae bacterium]|nr:GumC family protein [Steroidobacteraceae bacterium]
MNIFRNLPVLTAARAEVQPQEHMPSFDHDASPPGMSMAQLRAIVLAYRWQSILIAAAIVIMVAGVTKIMPKTYAATATLMVNYESNDPLAARGIQTGPVAAYISTEIELMQSSEVLLPVVDKLNLTADRNYTAGYKEGGGDLRDWVKDVLRKDLEIEQGRFGSQLIYITASARDPALAASIANAVADVYLDQQRQRVSGPASERAQSYARELAELKHKVSVAQDQVTAFRQKSGVTDAAAQTNNVEGDLLTSLELKYQEAQNQRRAAEVAASRDRLSLQAEKASDPFQMLRKRLNDQNSQLAVLRATMGPAHPKVIELENQIAATSKSLNDEITASQNSANADLAGARQLEQKLAAAVAEQRAKVLGVRKLQDEGTKYVLELESAQSVYKRALDGYDQIMFASGEHYANVNFISRAVPVMKAMKPNKPKLVLLGVLAGLLLGLGTPFVYELLFNRRVRCRDDFERGFGVPVLSEFDAIKFAPSSS